MAKRKKKFSKGLTVFVAIVLFAFGAVGGFFGCEHFTKPNDSDPLITGDLEIHFPELGNKYTGDCTYIKVGDVDVLIDAGSKVSSIPTIAAYLDAHMTDDVLEYVIVTHAHEDHYAGFATHDGTDSLFDLYEVKTIIDFAQITAGKADQKMYNNYLRERNEEIAAGAKHYTAAECIENDNKVFRLGYGVELEILDSEFYYEVSDTENNHSVCTMLHNGDEHFLFTGDLEKEGEESLVERNELPEVTLYKAGHHGSKTSSNDCLLEVIKPEIVTVCCCCGSSEYSDKSASQFPTQAFVDRIAPYTDRVYVTTLCIDYEADKIEPMNGNIVVTCNKDGVTVNCSANNTKLKDTEWFKEFRDCPKEWAS